MSTSGGTKAVIAAMLANLSIAILKGGAWALTGASSMLAEAVHSVADTTNQVLLLRGGRTALQPPDERHPLGYGRERYFSAFLVSVLLFTAGGVFALYEAYEKYAHIQTGAPDELLESSWWWVPIAVLSGAIVAEGLSLRTALVESRHSRGQKSVWAFIRNSRSPELPTVLLEDIAALLGLVFALIGVGLTLLTHNPYWDVVGTAMIGVLLVAVAWILGTETKSLLLGEAPTAEELAGIRTAIEQSEGVESIIHLKAVHVGPEEILVGVKIAVAPSLDAAQLSRIIDDAERKVRAVVPTARTIYVEPDIRVAT